MVVTDVIIVFIVVIHSLYRAVPSAMILAATIRSPVSLRTKAKLKERRILATLKFPLIVDI